MTYMNSVGTTVYLKASPRALTERIELCRHTRPAVRHLSGDPLYIFVSDALARRTPFYDQAQIIFDVERLVTHRDVRAAATRLWEIIRESCPS